MAEYIERDIMLAKFIEGDGNDDFTTGYNFAVNEYKDKLKAMPAADVQPVKRGKLEERIGYGNWGDTYYHCSVCGSDWVFEEGTPKANEWSFCPHCGADVRGDENA